jgi:hypothetical protein
MKKDKHNLQNQVLQTLGLSLVLSIDEKKYWHPKVLKMNRKQLEEFKIILDQETEGINNIVEEALQKDNREIVESCINNYDKVMTESINSFMMESEKQQKILDDKHLKNLIKNI